MCRTSIGTGHWAGAKMLGGTTIARLIQCGRGSTAVEFGLISIPFVAILLALIEVGLLFVAQETLDSVTSQTARLILTGQAQKQSMTAGQFQQEVCKNIPALFKCSGIYVNVQKFSSFG